MGTAVHEAHTATNVDVTALEREINQALDVGVILSGRHFRRQTAVTFERNVHTARGARDTGLVKACQGFDPLHDEVDERIESLILDAFTNGTMYRFLAAALGEDHVTWTPAIAAENARFFADLTDAVDQASLFDIASWTLLDFFLNAGGSWRIFLKYLRESTRTLHENPNGGNAESAGDISATEQSTRAATRKRTKGMRAATSTSANGMPLSAPSPARSIEIPSQSSAPHFATGSSTTSKS